VAGAAMIGVNQLADLSLQITAGTASLAMAGNDGTAARDGRATHDFLPNEPNFALVLPGFWA
jgi:hypothetical protein